MHSLHRRSASLLAPSEMLAAADDAELTRISLDDEHLCVEIDRALRFWCVAERLTELASRVRVAASTVTTVRLRDDVVARVRIGNEHALGAAVTAHLQ
jgi:hypothetical protein